MRSCWRRGGRGRGPTKEGTPLIRTWKVHAHNLTYKTSGASTASSGFATAARLGLLILRKRAMCAMRGSASGVGACGKSNNVVMLLPPSKLARKFLPGLLAPTPVPRIPNARALFRLHIRDTYTLFRFETKPLVQRERKREREGEGKN